LNKGIVYVYKRDRAFRPIFVCNVRRVTEMGTDIEFITEMACFLINFIMTRCLIPGQVENWTDIFDFKGVSLTNIPKNTMKGLNKPMADYFKGRLYRMYIINASWIMKILWKLAKKLIDPLTL
jgi:hypothetical protein